jgi:hypothetical protein
VPVLTYLTSSLQTSLQNQTKREGYEKGDFIEEWGKMVLMSKNEYKIERKLKLKKILNFKKYFSGKTINVKNFENNLPKYYQVYNDFWSWRKNFKYPEVNYLQRVQTIKPLPPDKLINDLAKSIYELKKIFIELKDYKAAIIFKLFINYVSQCIKAKGKVKFYNKGFFGSSPVSIDISTITGFIVEYFLDIKDCEDDPNAKEYSCGCGKYKGLKNKGFKCDNPKCHTKVSKDPIRPWRTDPSSSSSISSSGHDLEGKDYRKLLKEFKKLIKKKHNSYVKKEGFWGGPYKVLVIEELIDLFFTLDFHLDEDQLNLIFLNKSIEKKVKQNDNRIILSKTETVIELYWGDLKNGKPHGKGVSEKYETNEAFKKISKMVSPIWWKKYARNLNAKDLKGYIAMERYEGEWENGKKNGKGDLIIFADPTYYSNKDQTPAISERYKGTFKESELDGQIKQFDDVSKKWVLKNYKNGVVKN